jgi:hypothetical protein
MANHFPAGDGTDSSSPTLSAVTVGAVQYVLSMKFSDEDGNRLEDSTKLFQVPGVAFTDDVAFSRTGPGDYEAPSQLTLVNCIFTNGEDESGALVLDYTGFDQDDVESALASMLDGMVTAWAALLGVSEATIQSYMTVARSWHICTAGGEAGEDIQWLGIISEAMTYPTE